MRGYLGPATVYLRFWFSHSLQSHKKHILQKWDHIILGLSKLFMYLHRIMDYSQLHYCVSVFKALSRTMGGESVCSHQAQLIKQTTYCKPAGRDQTPFNLWNWIHNASHCDQVMQKITILRAWHGILMWDQLTFSHFHIPLSSRTEKFWNSSTNFSIRKYFPWKQKNLGVAPVLVQIISWPGTLSS